jgi:DNA-directed RNA polymerase specialized sigma24 family protein
VSESPPNIPLQNSDLIGELSRGSSLALVDLTRMITRVLVDHRAYDFRDRWDDFVEIVLGQLLLEHRARSNQADSKRCGDREALEVRLRTATMDELVGFFRSTTQWTADGEVPWCENSRISVLDPADAEIVVAGFRSEIEKLPEQRSQVLEDVYGDGCSFDQVAAHRKLPLRMVKRFLRESIWDLRERCGTLLRGEAGGGEERVKSCLRSLELDLPAFLVEPHLGDWSEFKAHYPICQDCSNVVARWTRVESMVREACDGFRRHPPAQDLISLHRDGEGLAYTQYISLMRHLDRCPACGEAMSLLGHFDRRPIAQMLTRKPKRGWGSGASGGRLAASLFSRLAARLRHTLGG